MHIKPTLSSVLGKNPPEPLTETEIPKWPLALIISNPKGQEILIPSVEEIPFLETYSKLTSQHFIIHRETGYVLITVGKLKLYLFWKSSCLEYTIIDETGNEVEIKYSRGDISKIPEEIAERFDFDSSRFDEYPKGAPRKEGMQCKRAPAKNIRRLKDKWKGGYKYSKSKNSLTDELIKTREIWKNEQEFAFSLLREHKIRFSDIALFFQDTESSIRERAKVRDMRETRKIVKKMQEEDIQKYGIKYIEWLRETGGKIY